MKILAADDDRILLRMLEAALTSAGHEVVLARDGTEAVAALARAPLPRMAILDWNMPGHDGVEVCRWLRSRSEAGYVYVILLTSRGETADRVAGLDSGADDFIAKPFHREELQARVRAGERLIATQLALEQAHAQLREQATHDSLTGLLNRGAVLSHLERDVARAGRDGSSVAVVMADIDHFKRVNDSFGHPAGDAVLREVAQRMSSALRASDALGRYGGEEFLLVLSATAEGGAVRVAERIRQRICQQPIAVGGAEVEVTCSFGVASCHSGRPTAEALIAAADDALYGAKRGGRNRVVLAPDSAPRSAPAAVSERP